MLASQRHTAVLSSFDDSSPNYHLTIRDKQQMIWGSHLRLYIKPIFNLLFIRRGASAQNMRKTRKLHHCY